MALIGIGIDVVEVHRFTHWRNKSETSLRRLFSAEELAYCLQESSKSAERFAVRFAAREALFKALQRLVRAPMPFLKFCRFVQIRQGRYGKPEIVVAWECLQPYLLCSDFTSLVIHASFTHTQDCAHAVIAVEQV